jgi:AcrR family transcriptional regulator
VAATPHHASRAYTEAKAGAEETRVRPTPAAAFAHARAIFRAGGRIDMVALAAEVGVARATLYRWTGDRDRLLADLCMAELEAIIDYLDRTTRGTGAKRVGRVASGFLEILSDNPVLQRFLTHEGEHGLGLVTAPDGHVRPRIVDLVVRLIEREASDRGYRPPADPGMLADAMVSLGERFLYHNGDPGMNPDPANAQLAYNLLLRET